MIHKIFDIKGTKEHQDWTVEAIEQCFFPYDLCIEGLRTRFGQTHVPIIWHNGMAHTTMGQVRYRRDRDGRMLKGSLEMRMNAKYLWYFGFDPYYLPPYPKKLGTVPDPDEDWEDDFNDPPGSTWEGNAHRPNIMRQALIHEIGHVVDFTYLTGAHRRRIYNAFHGELAKDIHPHGHSVILRDPYVESKGQSRTNTLYDDKIVTPTYDENGNIHAAEGNNRFTLLPGTPVPDVLGRENGFMRAIITDFSSMDAWFHPRPDPNAVWPVSEKVAYEYRVGESFAEAFAQTYSDVPGGRIYVHDPRVPGIQQVIAKTLTPWMLELYPNEQVGGGDSGQSGPDVTDIPPYIPPAAGSGGIGYIPPGHTYYWPLPSEPMPPSDPVGWTPVPGTGTINGFYATKKERRFHNGHQNYAPAGAILFESREAAVESGRVPCPQCNP